MRVTVKKRAGLSNRNTRSGRALVVATLLTLAGATLVAEAHGGDPSLIHACVKSAPPKKGQVFIVDPNQACPSGYTATDWAIAGPPGLLWKGAWDDTDSYLANDAVEYQGSAFVAIAPSTTSPPPILPTGMSWPTRERTAPRAFRDRKAFRAPSPGTCVTGRA